MGGMIPGFAASGQNVYGQIVDAKAGTVANGVTLEAYNQAHWSNYTIVMVEQAGSGRYMLNVPGYLPASRYFVTVYLQIGGSPASGDTPIDVVFFDWDGANVLGVGAGLNVTQINGSAPAAVNLALSANGIAVGAAIAGTLTTSTMTTNLAAAVANIYAGRVLYFTSGANAGLAVLVTAYAVTGGKVTFIGYNNAVAPVAPSIGDAFIII